MRSGSILFTVLLVIAAAFLFLPTHNVLISPVLNHLSNQSSGNSNSALEVPEAASSTVSSASPDMTAKIGLLAGQDEPYQPRLQDPPAIVKGIYLTSWTAGSPKRIAALADLVDKTELNAVVIDIKDYSGYVAYRTGIPEMVASGAEKDVRISRPNALIKMLHDKGIYVIGRISVFQDPVLSKFHPDWAIHDTVTGGLWADRKGLTWLEVGAQPVWDYHASLAKDALARGFDEINFDYIRFPSDGDLKRTKYSYWDEKTPQHLIVGRFFAYMRKQMPGAKLSADLFGLTTSAQDDLGIGQKMEDAFSNFDYVCPMVYPSHFASGYHGLKNPAANPYEVISLSMQAGLQKLTDYIRKDMVPPAAGTSTPPVPPITPEIASKYAKLRPWLQAFDLGAVYDTAKINAQIKAADDVLSGTPHYAGWLLWDPSNNYRSYPRP